MNGPRTTRAVMSGGSIFMVCAMWWCGSARAQAQGGVATGSAGQAVAKAGKEKEETCRVSGMVVKMVDGTPLKNATVQLRNDEDKEHTIAAKTGSDGRFGLKNVPAGRYKMTVRRNGFVEQEYGQQQPNDPGAILTLSAGQVMEGVTFRLTPSAVISGRVFNEDGEPEPNIAVMASRQMYYEGRRTVTTYKSAETDDLGGYRLFDIAPGRYFVSAIPKGSGEIVGDKEFSEKTVSTGGEQSYARTYYPGTPDASRAVAVSVKEGEEIPGIDIALKEVSVRRVRGRVINQITSKAGRDVEVGLIARTNAQEWGMGGSARVKKEDGTFEIANVTPGPYTLLAYWFDANETKMHVTSQKIEVGESDLEGLVLTLGNGGTVQGRVTWDGKPSLDRNYLSIGAEAADGGFFWDLGTRVDEKGQFTIKNVSEGDLRLKADGVSKDCYIKQITFGQAFVKNDVISVSKGGNPALEITVSSRGARVQGAVTDKDGLPATGVWVVAVPDESRRSLLRLFKSQTTDQYGKYDLRGLAPGTYRIFSWTGIEQGEWEDAEFLRPQEAKGELLEVQDEDVKTVNLKVIEKKSVGTE